MKKNLLDKTVKISLFMILSIVSLNASACADTLKFIDPKVNKAEIKEKPARIVSLVPAITEILLKLNEAENIKGITYYDKVNSPNSDLKIVGGFLTPSVDKIKEAKPDIIFLSSLHNEVRENFNGKASLVQLKAHSVDDIYKNINALGRMFNKELEAKKLSLSIKNELDLISKKVKKISASDRKRVIRLMGRNKIMTPGDDSFQNDFIRSAGGIPPVLNKKGNVVPITKEEWIKFNPQVIYACGGDRKAESILRGESGWKDVDAIKNNRIYYFPCDYTCRPSVNSGKFISLLASVIYQNEFEKKENNILKNKVFKSRKINIDLDYIKDVKIDYSYINDFVNKSLVLNFQKPMSITSTLEGSRNGIKTVGNHFVPPQGWMTLHDKGVENAKEELFNVLKKSKKNTSFIFTGADMDNIAVKKESYKDITVYAMVTAGVESNATRASRDEGKHYEPGTINILILSNAKLSPRAMTRAIITATEAKTAAMQDLDIRSKEYPELIQATGTGTDNIIVIEGSGINIDNTGGHSKAGELIAKVVYAGVKEAIYKQNEIKNPRSIFYRLQERNINLFGLMSYNPKKNMTKQEITYSLERTLLNPKYEAFMESALALSDADERGLIKNSSSFQLWCEKISEEIAGKKINKREDFFQGSNIPVYLKMAINGLLNGLYNN